MMSAQQDGTLPPGMLLSGIVPPLADAYYPRPETGPDLASRLRPGETVVLVPGDETDGPDAQGGTGKTQLAVAFAHAMWNSRAVEVLVWVNAARRESVITGFAQAANTVDAGDPAEDAEVAAARFVSWLAHTRRAVGADPGRPGRGHRPGRAVAGRPVRPGRDHHQVPGRRVRRPRTSR